MITEGNIWPSIGIEKRLFVDGIDLETGDQFRSRSTAARAVFFSLGLLFGLVLFIPLIIWIGVCCFRQRNKVVLLHRIPDLPSRAPVESPRASERTGLLGKLLGKK